MFAFAPLSKTGLPALLPGKLFSLLPEDSAALNEIGFTDFDVVSDGTDLETSGTLAWLKEIELSLPGLDAVSLVLMGGNGMTEVAFTYRRRPDFEVEFVNLHAALRLRTTLLNRVHKDGDAWVRSIGPDGSPLPVEIELGGVDLVVTADWDVSMTTTPTLSLPAVELGDTGIVLEMDDIHLCLSEKQLPQLVGHPGFKGISIGNAALHFTGSIGVKAVPTLVNFTDLLIGSSGFSGTIEADWDAGSGAGTLFGLDFVLKSLDVTLSQNVPTHAAMKGTINLPFFDQPLGVDLSFGADGGLAVALSAEADQPADVEADGGLITFTKENLLKMTLDSIGFEVNNGLFTVKLSGKLTPLVSGFDWPAFDVKELSIDSLGHVKLEGGWMDLPTQYSFDLDGFTIEITKLGFGKTDDGGKWIGFSGALNLVEGLSAGASVEGLRFTWHGSDLPKLTLEGAGVELEIPDVLRFKGSVSRHELTVSGEAVSRFDGDIALELLALGLTIDGTLVIGTARRSDNSRYRFFAIYLDAELPVGLPLGATGLSFYGFAGLFANNMEPNREPTEAWYGIGGSNDWYHRPVVGVTDLTHKWRNQSGSLAFGAGVTIGTGSDNGYTFAGKVVLLIIFPGPIIMLEGKANLMKERAKLASGDPLFRSLAVLDFRSDTFLIGLDAQYKTGDSGELIDLKVGAEAFYDVHDPLAWHIWLGQKEPKERRIRASIFRIFEANSYLMIDAHKLQTGAWVGYGKSWSFGPVGLTIEAWIEGNAVVSWKPAHFFGELWMHGRVAIRVFKFRLGLTVDARVSADVFDPFHVKAEISVSVDLPRPFKSRHVDAVLEWGPKPILPPVPLALQDVAIEHLLATTTWPLARGSTVLPVYDTDSNGYRDDAAELDASTELPPAGAPIVPVDARPRLTFARPMNDDALVGVNVQPVQPEWEVIGDPTRPDKPYRARFGLTKLVLSTWTGTDWQAVASAPQGSGLQALYGSWAPVPAVPDGGGTNVGQVKLWLWSKTPFDYTRHTSRQWDEWFTEHFGGTGPGTGYPCIGPAEGRTFCCDFDAAPAGPVPGHVWAWPGHKELALAWPDDESARVAELAPPVEGLDHALCIAPTDQARPGTAPEVEVRFAEPARRVTVLLAWAAGAPTGQCVDFRPRPAGSGPNPREHAGVVFEATASPRPAVTTIVQITTSTGPLAGLHLGTGMAITLPQDSDFVELMVTRLSGAVGLTAFDAAGAQVDNRTLSGAPGAATTVRIDALGIRRVVMQVSGGEAFLHQICWAGVPAAPTIDARAFDNRGGRTGPFHPVGSTLEVTGTDLVRIVLHGDKPFCVVRVCVDLGPDPDDVARREAMRQHALDELARWSDVGDVLEPHTSYRLAIMTRVDSHTELAGTGTIDRVFDQTEYAYFTTGGPPGLGTYSRPEGVSAINPFATGLEDLTRYVRQTVPATVPAAGQKPLLPRPVYRGYDVGVEFNQDYVDLMYRLDRRDLALYLYDANNLPVRDAQGRLVVVSNSWGKAEDLTLSTSDDEWITVLNGSGCASVATTVIPHSVTIGSSTPGQVLAPDVVYEARLVPLLLHELWTDDTGSPATGPQGSLGVWMVVDQTPTGGPSTWQVVPATSTASAGVGQATAIGDGAVTGTDPDKPGTLLLVADRGTLVPAADQPLAWTDYRLNVAVRSDGDGAIGVVFRYVDPSNYYRFSMDRGRRCRQLVRVLDGAPTVLDEDDEPTRAGFDYLITVEAVGPSLGILVDGEPVFSVEDPTFSHGRVGLYCWANPGARFADVRVDDFRSTAPVAYRFKLTTSNFVDFFHHLHSFTDRCWPLALSATQLSDADVHAAVLAAVALGAAVEEAETRAYESFAGKVLGPAAYQDPPKVEVTRLRRPGAEELALVVCSPEPIDWRRTSLEVEVAATAVAAPTLPSAVKLTDVAFAADRPNDESVSVLLDTGIDPSGWSVEQRSFGAPLPVGGGELLFVDDEHRRDAGRLLREAFGAHALDGYSIVDQGDLFAPSTWSVSSGSIVQTSGIRASNSAPTDALHAGTMATTGPDTLGDLRLQVTVRSDDGGAIGIVFRYTDPGNYYRLSMDSGGGYRRLVRCTTTPVATTVTTVTTVWEDLESYDLGRSYRLRVEAYGNSLVGFIDDAAIFAIRDAGPTTGRVGFYCAGSTSATFESLEAETLDRDPVLWSPDLATLDAVTMADAANATGGPSLWSAADGALVQSSAIAAPVTDVERRGTLAVGRAGPWSDMRVSARLRADTAGAIGLHVRHVDDETCYAFQLDSLSTTRRLVRRVAGVATVLWEEPVGYEPGQAYDIALEAVGTRLTGFVDGQPLFDIVDPSAGADLGAGRVAFSCASTAAHFERVVVTDPVRRVGPWDIIDVGPGSGPCAWRATRGTLAQLAAVGGGTAPASPGALAVTGHPEWTDYRCAVRLHSDGNGAVGAVVRYVDDRNHYRFSLGATPPFRRLDRVSAGVVTTLWADSAALAVGPSTEMTIEVVGSRLRGWVDGQAAFDVVDGILAAGRVGLYTADTGGARFERVEVRRPSAEASALLRDRFSQDDVAGWDLADSSGGGTTMWSTLGGALVHVGQSPGATAMAGEPTWTDIVLTADVTPDSGAVGITFRSVDADNAYTLVFVTQGAPRRRLHKRVAGVSTTLWEDGAVNPPGQVRHVGIVATGSTLRGFLDGVPLFVVEDSDLPSGRIGFWATRNARIANVRAHKAEAAGSEWLLDESFDGGFPGRWNVIDEGDQRGPSAWSIVDGELHQTSSITSETDHDDGHDGGIAVDFAGTEAVTGDPAWTDYRLNVCLRSEVSGAIGAVFRFVDPGNCYRFSMDRTEPYRRLVKKVRGELTTLWEDETPFELHREYLLTIECEGNLLTGYLDGVRLFHVVDGDMPAGQVGVYCWANNGARFGEVQVAAPCWAPYYSFVSEQALAAGTRVRMLPGNADDPASPDPSVTDRYASILDDLGNERLVGHDVRLRVLDPDGNPRHVRTFLRPDAYVGVQPTLLRKADGTAFALFVPSEGPSGTELPPGNYRLRLTFRRDNHAADPTSQLLKEAGSTTDEVVTIDLPSTET